MKYRDGHYLTVGRLKEFLEEHRELSDDAIVVVERVEDVYYEKHGWTSYMEKGDAWYYNQRWNDDIDSGKYLDKDQYPNIKESDLVKFTDEQMEESKTQYHPIWCCVKRKDDDEILFLDLHY